MRALLDELAGVPAEPSPAELYHENSKAWRRPGGGPAGPSAEALEAMSHGYKAYHAAPAVPLPAPRPMPARFDAVVAARRSTRTFTGAPLSLADASTVLAAVNGPRPGGGPFRAVPSAGGLQPLECYLVTRWDAPGLPAGAWHHDLRRHRLEALPVGTDPEAVAGAVFVAETTATAPAFLVVTGVFGRSRIKYGERAYRFALLEAGHVVQNAALACAALGLGLCPFGGFVDDEVAAALDLDGVDEAPLYLAALGPAADVPAPAAPATPAS